MVPEIDAKTLREELDGPNPPIVLDVREPDELMVSRLPDEVVNVPLSELDRDSARLDPEASYVVVCRVGGRSAQATAFLLGQGFTDVRNLAGGMNGYAARSIPRSRCTRHPPKIRGPGLGHRWRPRRRLKPPATEGGERRTSSSVGRRAFGSPFSPEEGSGRRFLSLCETSESLPIALATEPSVPRRLGLRSRARRA